MTDTQFNFKKTLMIASLSALFAIGLTGCSEDKSEPLSSNSGAGVSAPAASQPSAADVKQPMPEATTTPEKMVEAVEEKVEVIEEKVEAAVETVETKVEETIAAVAPTPAVKSGASLYATCIGCHGAAGEGGVGPKLSGQAQSDIAAKLVKYKAGEQVGPMTAMMAPMAQGLDDEEIKVVSEYIAGL